MKSLLKKNFLFIFFFVLVIVFYWKAIFAGKVPFPGDLLVGGYYPWLNNRWGYAVGVPIKNAELSDVFSQFFVWKILISDAYRQMHFPLWNSYSYGGYPLLANFHSGALNPANVFMVLFRGVAGWNLMIMFQTFGMLCTMGLYLKARKRTTAAIISGSVTYAFSGFATTWSQFMTAGFAMVWIPLMLFIIESYFATKRVCKIILLAPLIFLLVTAGHFQSLIFGMAFVCLYFVWKLHLTRKNYFRHISIFSTVVLLGIALSAIQLLPTYEYLGRSIRGTESYVADYNYGLLPFKNILTIYAPDFFGNPATGNHVGFFNYHETVLYTGVAIIFAFITSIYRFKKLGIDRLFVVGIIVGLLLVFDNPIGKFVYTNNLPFISTSVAGRVVIIMTLCSSVLVSWWVDELRKIKMRELLRYYWWMAFSVLVVFGITFTVRMLFLPHADVLAYEIANATIAFRNLILPTGLFFGLLITTAVFYKTRFLPTFIALIIIFDMFRFGWKYVPFVPADYVYPIEQPLEYLKSQQGPFRVEREHAGIVPPNTWAAYSLMSLSGYDPMAPHDYVGYYETQINKITYPHYSRYSELEEYDAEQLGNLGVKYLLGLRWSPQGEVVDHGEGHYYKIDDDQWKPIRYDGGVVLFENKFYKPILRLENEGQVNVTRYNPGLIEGTYNSSSENTLIAIVGSDPGWKAYVDDMSVNVHVYDGVFMKIDVAGRQGKFKLKYEPESFKAGLRISAISFLLWLLLFEYAYYHKNEFFEK